MGSAGHIMDGAAACRAHSRAWFLALFVLAAIEFHAVAGKSFRGGQSGKRNFFNSEANLRVDTKEFVATCYGRPCPPIKIPEDPRSQKVLVLLESSCPSMYDEDLETYCTNPATAFGDPKKCFGGKLPYQDKRALGSRGIYKAAYTAVFRRVTESMVKLGWKNFGVTSFNSTRSWGKLKSAHIVICNIYHFRLIVQRYPEKRYILINNNDAATITVATGCNLDDPRILGIWQHTALLPVVENNGPLVEARRHFSWLIDVEQSDNNYIFRWPKMTTNALSKVDVIIPQIYRWRYPLDCGGRRGFTLLQPAFHLPVNEWIKPFAQRRYDITFVGTVTSAGPREGGGVNGHRKNAITAIQLIKTKYPNLNVFTQSVTTTYENFVSILRDTKVFISPYGLGEFSGKDYEAMLAGCLLVKPWAHKLKAYPNIYSSNYTLNVALDFSDLEEVLIPYFKDAQESGTYKMAYRRVQSQIQLLKQYSRMEQVAKDLDSALLPLVSRPVAYDIHQCRKSLTWAYHPDGRAASEQERAAVAQAFEDAYLSVETDPWSAGTKLKPLSSSL